MAYSVQEPPTNVISPFEIPAALSSAGPAFSEMSHSGSFERSRELRSRCRVDAKSDFEANSKRSVGSLATSAA